NDATTMKVLSLFSGVGGFDMGLENAGMQTVFQCEWDKHCRTILDRHWSTVPKWDDVSTLTGEYILAHAPVIDVVAWGSPCQDLSVAGKRAGLEGGRSGLFYEGMRIINELRKASNGKYPRISIWENVYGALNSNKGEDFEAILKEMVEAGSLLCEWRVLDAQYFGVPQRRRRVFVVAVFDSATAERCPDPLLPVSEGLRWNPTTGAATREDITDTVTGSIGSGSRMRGFGDYISDDTASAIKARDHKDATDLVIEPFTPSSFAQYEQGVGTLRSNGGDLGGGSETLLLDGTRVNDVRVYESPVQTLKERMGTGGNNVPMLMFDTQFGSNANVFENQSPTLKASQAAPSVAYGIQGNMIGRQDHNGPGGKGHTDEGDPMFTLNTTDKHAVATTMAVRRLTPLECERLMGWPDDHTRYKADGTEQADTHRYKQCGNGVASPV
ncbi:MAG: DNA (cytosine-5-)-methyltransferase, partial [Caulobacteraceae bacterium]|nr:DNA (cytosine-5-)-methyltransferase [Caulobacteraceae bacterium]